MRVKKHQANFHPAYIAVMGGREVLHGQAGEVQDGFMLVRSVREVPFRKAARAIVESGLTLLFKDRPLLLKSAMAAVRREMAKVSR